MIGHEREPRRDNQASGFSKDLEIRVSPKRPEETDSFSQRKAADLTASRKGIRPRVLTYEELGRNNGNKKMVVEELEDCRREMRRSVSNRNGGSHMMLDNKTEQK